MRLLIYNIAYGTGAPKTFYHQLWNAHRYIRTPQSHLNRIIRFIDESNADLVGLIEVDTGSYRTNYINQVEVVANHLQHYHRYSNKYGEKHLFSSIPYLRDQANAVLTREDIPDASFHYFPFGFKRLIIEVDIKGVRFFLVHLALRKRTRKKQLEFLTELANSDSPTIIAGDFNIFKGTKEIRYLQEKLNVVNSNTSNYPTYPSWKPKKQLDFILCSPDINILNFEIPQVKYSDHLPLIMDFE